MKVWTKEEWKALSSKERWDVMTALRGPDCHYPDNIKWFTTAVIRAAVRQVLRQEGTSAMVNTSLGVVVLPRLEEDAAGTRWCYSHFVLHTSDAAEILGIPQIRIPDSIWLNLAQPRYTVWAAMDIYRALDGKPEQEIIHRHMVERGWMGLIQKKKKEVA